MDGLVFQIVNGADVADGATTCAHENGVGDGFMADEFHSRKERTFDDACRTKDRTLAGDDVGRAKNGLDLFFWYALNFASFCLGAGEPHAKLNFSAQGVKSGRCENTLWGSADSNIKIDSGIGKRRGHRSGDVPIGDGAKGCSSSTDRLDKRLVAWSI